jgi:DNA-directed RNA polymerase alpha subunit
MLIDYINVLLLFKEKHKMTQLEDKCKIMREKLMEKWKNDRKLEEADKKKRFKDTKDDIKLEVALNCFVDLDEFYNEQITYCQEMLNNIDEYIKKAATIGTMAVNKKIKKLENIIITTQKDEEDIKSIKSSQKHDLIQKMRIKNKKIEKYKKRHEEI